MRLHNQPLPSLDRPSPAEFQEAWESTGLPLVIHGVVPGMPIREVVRPERLQAIDGSVTIDARACDDEFESFFGSQAGKRTSVNFSTYVRQLLDDARPPDPVPYVGNMLVSEFGPRVGLWTEDIAMGFPDYLGPASYSQSQIWFALRGQRSTIHIDPTHNWNAQLFGRKRYRLFHAEERRNLAPRKMTPWLEASELDLDDERADPGALCGYQVELRAGEMLFIPAGWWHQALAVSGSISVNRWVVPAGKRAEGSEPVSASPRA